MNKNKFLILQLVIIFIFSFSNITSLFTQTLPTATSTLFSGSGNCAICHIAGNGVLTTQTGIDISPTTLWRSTMMANAARDPLWQAKVSTEVIEHPLLQSVIEDKCTTCHSPMGRTQAIYNGADHFSFQEALVDPLSLDGVSCTLCHQIQNADLGTDESFSGGFEVSNAHDIFGPYLSPTTMPMFNQTGYTPVYAEYIHHSEICATCHTLFTPFVNNQGHVVGYFPEQTPYLEWKNSIYPAETTDCQTCHMPLTDESMKIAINPPWLTTQRSPIWGHDFVGGNAFMNSILKMHSMEIGVTATEVQFDSTISRTTKMLQEQSINLSAEVEVIEDTLNVIVQVENLSGHKFPTGFPSRRAWLHIMIKNSEAETLFESGKWDSEGEISGLDDGYEPHYDVISSQDQVQVYQSVMKDVDGNVTYTLLRGAQYAKDNRLPPKGFTTSAPEYESTEICGEAAADDNFNRSDNIEGSGSDQIHYKYAVTGKGAEFFVTVQMLYQTVAPQFAQDLFSHETDNIARFKDYYDGADKSPILLKSVSLNNVNTGIRDNRETQPAKFGLLRNYPNPFNPSTRICFEVSKSGHIILKMFNILGDEIDTLINAYKSVGVYEVNFRATHLPSGIYLCKMVSGNEIKTHKILLAR